MDKVYLLAAIVGAIGFLVAGATGIIQATASWPSVQPQHRKWLYFAIIAFFIVSVVSGGATYLAARSTNSTTSSTLTSSSSSSIPSATTTSIPIVVSPSPISSPTATSTPLLNNYAAAQPGNSCDTGGGTWTSQGLNPFSCGQSINPVSTGVWGYLSLQLPNNAAFSANNKITVTGSPFGNQRWVACIGLAEMGASTGYLAAFCGNGLWSVYTISNNGTIIQTLRNNIPTTLRASATISFTLSRNTLLFTIDTEHYQIPISSIQPTQIAIGVEKAPGCDTCSVLPANFSYITSAS